MTKRARVRLSASTGSQLVMSESEKRLRSPKTAEAPAATRTRRRSMSACMKTHPHGDADGRLGCPLAARTETGSPTYSPAGRQTSHYTQTSHLFCLYRTV